jgi:Carboxypeptidase regulatory-like domain
MTLKPLLLAAGFALALFTAAPAAAQAVHGRVTDASDGTPVSAATIEALDAAGAVVASAMSGADGRYELPLPAGGSYALQVSRVGYRTGRTPPVPVGDDDRIGFELRITAAALTLDAVQVEAEAQDIPADLRDPRARGFYKRMQGGIGRYLSPDRVERMTFPLASSMLRSVPGVTFREGSTRTGLWMGGPRTGCSPTLYVDGRHIIQGVRVDEVVGAEDIWAVEVYRYDFEIPADLPREVPPGAWDRGCGAVLIWTRRPA